VWSDVHGVAYEVDVPMSTFFVLPGPARPWAAAHQSGVREDGTCCSASATEEERRCFRQLLKISGVGARTALAVLSGSVGIGAINRAVSHRMARVLPRSRHRQENRGALCSKLAISWPGVRRHPHRACRVCEGRCAQPLSALWIQRQGGELPRCQGFSEGRGAEAIRQG